MRGNNISCILRNREIAMETIRITEQGFYEIDGERYEFDFHKKMLEEVFVYDPEKVEDFINNEDGYLDDYQYEYDECKYMVVNMDSFEANYEYAISDRALVMNFANAHHPGGGFLNGASAQEESLCRCSTLFASIGSRKAGEMYDYNNENLAPFDSDYMLISPYVTVFRDAKGKLRTDKFNTAVVTVPAPNLNGLARNADRKQLAEVMKYKIEGLLCVALRDDYDTLILGAWGCGAFGHDAKKVSEYFKEVIVDMEYYKYFKKIIFAVFDPTQDKYNYKAFLEEFGAEGSWKNAKK